jgi:hypothetical protein
MIKYMHNYESRSKYLVWKLAAKQRAWGQVVPELEQGLTNDKGFELSIIQANLNSIDDQCNFRNRDVKVFLINQFGSAIDFTYPDAFL